MGNGVNLLRPPTDPIGFGGLGDSLFFISTSLSSLLDAVPLPGFVVIDNELGFCGFVPLELAVKVSGCKEQTSLVVTPTARNSAQKIWAPVSRDPSSLFAMDLKSSS